MVFFTPGSGFQVSAKEGAAPIEFDNLRPDASTKFAVFSRPRLFTALASPITEILFFVPGTAQAATTKGFGSVFTDVDRHDSTTIEYFDVNGSPLFSRFVPAARGDDLFRSSASPSTPAKRFSSFGSPAVMWSWQEVTGEAGTSS